MLSAPPSVVMRSRIPPGAARYPPPEVRLPLHVRPYQDSIEDGGDFAEARATSVLDHLFLTLGRARDTLEPISGADLFEGRHLAGPPSQQTMECSHTESEGSVVRPEGMWFQLDGQSNFEDKNSLREGTHMAATKENMANLKRGGTGIIDGLQAVTVHKNEKVEAAQRLYNNLSLWKKISTARLQIIYLHKFLAKKGFLQLCSSDANNLWQISLLHVLSRVEQDHQCALRLFSLGVGQGGSFLLPFLYASRLLSFSLSVSLCERAPTRSVQLGLDHGHDRAPKSVSDMSWRGRPCGS